MKKRREAGVGLIVKVDPEITVSEPDVSEPRVMAVNIKVFGFNLRVITCSSPTNIDGSPMQKDNFYRTVRKAINKKEKHQKIIVAGDFNAQTSIAFKQRYFDGIKIVDDNSCNENGNRLKSLCREYKLCISQTYFNHSIPDRCTWYSNDR